MARSSSDDAHLLRSHMQRVGISSFKALSQVAGVSEWQVKQLRQGLATQMRLEVLYKLSQALQISLPDLLHSLAPLELEERSPIRQQQHETVPLSQTSASQRQLEAEIQMLKQEYQRLQTQLMEQQQQTRQELQRHSLQILESLLLQLPTAAYAAQQNPQVPASRLLPLLRPIEQLLQSWGIDAIAPVGAEVPFDPHDHQLMEGIAQPGDQVRVRYTGYRQGDTLLYRAKVSPVMKS